MKRLLEASMEASYNSMIINETGAGYPIFYINPAFTSGFLQQPWRYQIEKFLRFGKIITTGQILL